MEQVELLRYALAVLDTLGVPHMVVGSMASMAYGEPRLTRDIDIVVDLALEQVDALCRAFPDPEYYVSQDAANQAVRRRGQFNVIHPTSGNKIDFMIARDDEWGSTQLARRKSIVLLPDLIAPTAAPEDVIVAKMLYYQEGEHEKHLRDIAAMLRISSDEIDRAYISEWSNRLGLDDIWHAIRVRIGEEGP